MGAGARAHGLSSTANTTFRERGLVLTLLALRGATSWMIVHYESTKSGSKRAE